MRVKFQPNPAMNGRAIDDLTNFSGQFSFQRQCCSP